MGMIELGLKVLHCTAQVSRIWPIPKPCSLLTRSRLKIPGLTLQFSSESQSGILDEGPAQESGAVNISSDSDSQIGSVAVSVFKPRVAPLPEDLSPEQFSALKTFQSADAKRPKDKVKEAEAIPYPTFASIDQKKRKSRIVLADAIREIKANARKTFDETVEAHVRLGIDPRRGDQMVRGAATLPHGCGKVVRVAVFAEGAAAQEATKAGADVVGADELVARIQDSGGKLEFDKCIATPGFMPKLSKVARILGPRGLMPNPKVGTVTNNVGDAVRALKQGRVDFRADKSGIVHAGLGKVSFEERALLENIAAFTGALLAAKPAGLKKTSRYAGYVNSFTLTSTMGAGVRVTVQSVAQAADSFAKSTEAR